MRLTRGRTNAEIADEPSISLTTTHTHLASRQARARHRVELAMWAYETTRANR